MRHADVICVECDDREHRDDEKSDQPLKSGTSAHVLLPWRKRCHGTLWQPIVKEL